MLLDGILQNLGASLLRVLVGTALAWGMGRMDGSALANALHIQTQMPQLFVADMVDATFSAYMIAFLVLTSAGLAVVFGMMRVINLAHGEFVMLGVVARLAGLPPPIPQRRPSEREASLPPVRMLLPRILRPRLPKGVA